MRLFVDNLCNVDFSYLCPERGLVGETWLASVELTGELDDQGMVCDFGIVKKTIRAWLDANVDHCLLVPTECDAISASTTNECTTVSLDDRIKCVSPAQAIALVPCTSITPASVAKWCVETFKSMFKVADIKVTFAPEKIEGAFYHYSHGLKKHNGNCQRIAHGHRSKLEIWKNGAVCEQSIKVWCAKWRDIYIATREDCVAKSPTHLSFEYTSQQGFFSLTLPRDRCYFIDTDTTVEFIALHILTVLRQHYPSDEFIVKAFEGIGKGAIVESKPPIKLSG